MDQLLYSVAHAAPLLDVKETMLRELIDAGVIPTVRLRHGGHRFIRRQDLEAFIANLSPEVAGAPAKLPNPVTNNREAHRTPTPRNGREPITPVRFSATEEANP